MCYKVKVEETTDNPHIATETDCVLYEVQAEVEETVKDCYRPSLW
jgi:hypothetical protein